MSIAIIQFYGVMFLLLLLPALCVSEDTYTCLRATYYGSPGRLGTPSTISHHFSHTPC
ncbi:hypothetical protein Syun_010320 [Stephania yunnanensis]|uniref:Uncharacterized protein n=1 Tax=Stephania yunnanensis TaxID=152371 RepID=A0AAP0KGB2_9MAGN